jgi:hypothetical protein
LPGRETSVLGGRTETLAMRLSLTQKLSGRSLFYKIIAEESQKDGAG